MSPNDCRYGTRMKALALALLAVFGTARAEDENPGAITSQVSVGAGVASGDPGSRSLFGDDSKKLFKELTIATRRRTARS